MTFDTDVLRAMLRLARRREEAAEEALSLRVGLPKRGVRQSLRRLEEAGLVELRAGRTARLTLEGLAVALSTLPVSQQRPARAHSRTPRAA